MGSYLGSVIGWRGAFFCLIPVALIALLWQWISLPALPAAPRKANEGNVFALFKRRRVALGMLGAGLFFMGQFVLFTYLRPFLETVTRVDVSMLSIILLVIGVAGFIGTVVIGSVLKKGLYRVVIAIPLLMAMIAVALIGLGSSVVATFVLLGLWG